MAQCLMSRYYAFAVIWANEKLLQQEDIVVGYLHERKQSVLRKGRDVLQPKQVFNEGIESLYDKGQINAESLATFCNMLLQGGGKMMSDEDIKKALNEVDGMLYFCVYPECRK
ncbi:hypothetical protein Leryth_012094 [Lithospermum erythrorhizon]|nr:hypothetical protein Leryth_012094 [Lithospermum erythrorhizon]